MPQKRAVTSNFGGKNYTATVDAQGNWTVNIPSGDFTNLKDGPQPITVTATDAVGNSNNISGSAQIDKTLPVLTINPITGDNVINAAEAHSPIVISGTAPVSDSGQSVVVKVVVNGATYTANVNLDGTWNLTLPAGALNGVSDGNIVFNASLTDVAGNTGTINQVVKLDASAANQPTIHIGTVSGDDYINASEINAPLTISGTSTNVEANQIVTITLNGKTYTTSVNADGSWSYNIPTADVKQLPDGIDGINVSVSDTSGNPATDSHNVTVIAQPADLPTIHVNTVAGDNVINAKEAQSDLQITGTTTHVTNGQTVTVTLGGKTYIGSVDANGLWSVTVPAADVQKLDQGSQNIVANVNDVAKNRASDTHNVQVDTQAPLLSIDLFVTDNVLNYAEALVSQILSGKTDAGQTVSVTINNKTVQVTADGNGIWKLTVSAGDLQALPDGTNTITVTATDSAGNTTSKDLSLNVGTHLLPTLTLDTPFVDGILSIVESATGGVLTGTSTHLLQGTKITVNIGGVQIIGSVGANGDWSIPVGGHLLDVLADGKATITVTATDSYGNIGSATGQLDVLTHFEPTATLTLPLFGDNVLNNAEALLGQKLTGNSGLLGAGQTVYITLDGTKYVGAVDANGNWTVQLPSNVLSALSDSSHTLSVTLTDRAGNTETSSSANFTAKITLPIPTLDTPFGDGILNFVDAQTATTLHGLSGLATNVGVSVIVNINGTPVTATVNPNGSWTLPLDAPTLQGLPDGIWSLSVTVKDAAGNVVTSPTQTAEVLTHVLPLPTINLPFGDGLLSIAEAGASQILTGSTGITGAGQIVKVTIGTQTLNAVVTTDGQWTLSVLPSALATVTNGSGAIHVEVTDHAGNVGSTDGNFIASLVAPVPTIGTLFNDGLLNIGEANDTIVLTGTTGSTGANQQVKLSVDIGGVTYTGSVDTNGIWTITLPPKALLGIGNGEHEITLTAQDAAGNSTTITPAPTFTAYLTPPSVTLDTPFGDGALNVTDGTSVQILHGSLTLNNSAVAGSKVIVTINGHDFTATINPDGTSWSLNLQPSDMTAVNLGSGLQDIKVTVTDAGLNTGSSTGQAFIGLTSPTILVSTNFASDGLIDYAELHASQTISGTSTGLSVGQNVSIAIGGQTFLAQVKADGSWTYNLNLTELASLASGAGTLVVSANDAANNHVDSLTTIFTLNPIAVIPVLTVDPVGGDNLLGLSDLNGMLNITISGHSSNILPGTPVLVTLDSLGPYVGTITSDGSWSVSIPRAQFTDGPHTISADALGDTGTVNFTVDTLAPSLSVNVFAVDDKLNAAEVRTAQVLSGTASTTEIGQNVQIVLNGKNYVATVVSDGGSGATWSVSIPATDLALLGQGNNDIKVTLTDKAGNSTVVTHPVNVDTVIPLVNIDPLSVGSLLNSVNIGAGILLNGSAEPNSSVTIKVGTLAGVTVQTDNNGKWSLNVPKVDLQGLTDGPQVITVTSTDSAGNVSVPVNVGLNVALNQGFGDTLNTLIGGNGVLNLAESLLTQVLTGTVSGNYTGAKVSATILGQLFTADVGNNGKWSINIDPSFWLSSALGKTLDFDLVLTDPNGNIVHTPVHVDLALTDLPLIQNVVAIGDGFLNQLESTANNVVTGTLGNMVAGTTVDVQLGIGTFHATVNANGTWSATIPQNVLAGLQDGSVKVVIIATDPAGNVVTSNTNLSVITHNLPTLVLDPLFGDGVLSLTEALAGGLSIGGSTSGMVGQTLQVLIGGSQVATAVVGANGKWSIVVTPQILGILEGVVGGNVTVEVKGNDVAGNPVDQTVGLKLDLTPPILSGISLFGDGLLNAVDATTNQLITGTATGAPLGSTVNVLIGGKTFTGVTLANGTFSIVLTPANLAQLPDGSLTATVTVTTLSGNTSSTTAGVKVGLTNLPTITLDPLLSGDGFLNKAESLVDQVISGKVTNLTSGTVNITVNGTPLTATINPNGTWSATLKAGLLSGLADGPLNINVSVTDAVGNTSSLPTILTTLTHNLPTITLGSLFGDGVLSVGDLLTSQLISGTTSNLAGGSLTLTLGSKIYTVPVGSGGAWSLSVSPLDLKALLDGNLTVGITAKDAAGNPASASGILSVVTHALPTLTIGSIFGDGGLNIGDLVSAQVISGTSTNAQGSQLTVTLGGKSYLTTVGNDGSWSISVPKTDLSLLGDGNLGVNVSLTNPIGNTTSAGGSLNVITHLPTVGISSGIFGDGILNIAESGVSQLLTGTVTSALPGAKVVVTVGTVDYQATVNANGTWSLNLTSTQLKSLTDGSLHIGVKVTDVVGNTNSTGVDVGIKLSQPLLGLNVVTLPSLGDLLLGGKLLVITGTSKNLQNGAALHVSLLNDTLAADTTVDSNGNWSASLGLTLNLLQLLLLNKVVNLSAHDSAGNGVIVNVGLDGHIIDVTPTSAPAPAMMMAMSIDDVSASHSGSQDHLSQSLSTSSLDDSATASTSGTFTIGGVTIDLADGTHNSGASVSGGAGNDKVHVSDVGFTHIDGGAGTDTLVLDGSNLNLDLTSLGLKVEHIEIFDLGKAGNNAITLDLKEALNVTDKPQDDLLIKGSIGDRVNLVHGQGDIWDVSGQREVNGVTYDVYHNSSTGSSTLGDVLIQQGLHVNLM
uniref:Ig-like domain-containing protein n=1 Tax=Hafnia alvei TaxID=569 RepID=UPI00242E6335|nr:Ig-like domain-containing protein [Hafnia alvei]